jgi:hypothetical protein
MEMKTFALLAKYRDTSSSVKFLLIFMFLQIDSTESDLFCLLNFSFVALCCVKRE